MDWRADELASINRGFSLDLRAEVAIDIAKTYSIVAGTKDGEDSVGRAAFRLQTPEEVVVRAVAIADGLVTAFEQRGWVRPLRFDRATAMAEEAKMQQAANEVRWAKKA